jgi:hypothetical protein
VQRQGEDLGCGHKFRQFGTKKLEISCQNSIILKRGITHSLQKGKTKMAKENAEKFEKLLISDEKLQAKLRAAMDAYTGDRRDEKAVYDAVVLRLAEEAGLPFTFEEAREYASKDREISLEEGDAAAGGEDPNYASSWCVVLGFGNETDMDFHCGKEYGGGICDYVGVGIINYD